MESKVVKYKFKGKVYECYNDMLIAKQKHRKRLFSDLEVMYPDEPKSLVEELYLELLDETHELVSQSHEVVSSKKQEVKDEFN